MNEMEQAQAQAYLQFALILINLFLATLAATLLLPLVFYQPLIINFYSFMIGVAIFCLAYAHMTYFSLKTAYVFSTLSFAIAV